LKLSTSGSYGTRAKEEVPSSRCRARRTDRPLDTTQIQPDSQIFLLWLPLEHALLLVLALVGYFTWPWLVGGVVFLTAWAALDVRLRLVPSNFVEGLTEQLVSDLDAVVVHRDSQGQRGAGAALARAGEGAKARAPEADDVAGESRLDLTPSGRNTGTIWYLFKHWYTWCLPVLLVLVGAMEGSVRVMVGGFILVGLVLFLVIRGTLDAFATTSIIHRRCGFLGLSSEDVPIAAIDEVFVDPLPVLPESGR